jgi:alkanesulfonate monooxygenase SsuD/methylene tetrahydromethanopterin reductase-like flavin-dependent oxidoreductase (luciferase family)
MKTDLLLVPMGASYAQMRETALAAEEAGFDGLWTWDHLRDPDGRPGTSVPEVWTTLSALAEATRRIALGPLVLNVGSRHPGLVASMAATLQQVSGGRLLLGVGAGASRALPYAAEYDMLGLPVEPDAVRAQRVGEAAEVMRRLWGGDASSFAGRYYRLERPAGFLRPSPPPPIIVGGFGPRMASIAGRHGDGFNTQAAHPKVGELIRIARDEHAAAGRDPAQLIVTVFAGLGERWLDPGSRERVALAGKGVHRLILLAQPPYDPQRLRAAGRTLTGRG